MRGHILVIDDEEYIYEDLKEGLGKAHVIHYAKTLSRINNILSNYPVDMAVVDLNMKVGDLDRFSGLEYIKTLRRKYPNLTIIVLSAYSDAERIVQATKNGADHYIIKAYMDPDSDEFREQVRQWINSKKKLDEKRQLKEMEGWGNIEFPGSAIETCNEYFEKKAHFILAGEDGLGKQKLLEHSYKKSRHFKVNKSPEIISLQTYELTDLEKFLQLKPGHSRVNFLKSPAAHIQFVYGLVSLPKYLQLMFLELCQNNRFIGKRDILNHQLIFLLNAPPNDLIINKKVSPEITHILPLIVLNPLRNRRAELKNLINNWEQRKKVHPLSFDEQCWTLLRRYAWPGNLTELYGVLNKILEKHKKQFPLDWNKTIIEANSLPQIIQQSSSDFLEDMHFDVARIQLKYIEQALITFEGQRRQKDLAAQALKIHSADNLKKTFINKYWEEYPDLVRGFPTIMKKYKLDEKRT